MLTVTLVLVVGAFGLSVYALVGREPRSVTALALAVVFLSIALLFARLGS